MHKPRTTRRTRQIAGIGAIAALALAGTAATAAATPIHRPEPSRTVVSGQARFEVLSPTLIRTEYAGDSHFLDAATFNVVGRDDFKPTRWTSSTANGWLTIDTGQVQLRYQTGSGPFTADNLRVSLTDGQQAVTGAPWPGAPNCAVNTLCEAEDLDLSGLSVASDHSGHTGTGFAAGWGSIGNSLSFRTNTPTAGSYDLDLRYANSTGGDGKNTTRTLSVSVDGGAARTVSFPPTANWDTWALATTTLQLTAGAHSVVVSRGQNDSGNLNLDSLAVVPSGAAYPGPAASTCQFGVICEAESGTLTGGGRTAADHNDYSGRGFAAGLEHAGAGDTLTVTGVPATGRYDLQLRYANYQAGSQPIQSRTVSVGAGAATPTTVTLAPTSSWDAWRTVRAPVTLQKGTNQLALTCPTDASCNVNLDTATVTAAGSPLLAPHAPLGGYRRGLDAVDGGATTAAGLLYSDGWSLLDDTASALWDAAADTTTARSDHSDLPYQDGYVFGYGQNYAAALRDLSTLTGPAELLPRWTYGTWYSEYYDRSQSDIQNTLLPAFRSEGVPLDALVVDTDFKSPNKWNGWEIDPSRFPDPKAFFNWAHSQGLHTSLNIHPSILAADPKFADAQAAAGGSLQPGSCGGGGTDCYVFDWGNPQQLAAYLGLHADLEKQGVDFWWLDWCCDGSSSSRPGVTADSWINEQYARDSDKTVGRGFAFSRAYGSLQSGGYGNPTAVPTGPWADKRTTLHFTGDTISDWATLHYEVGYTPGESVATGNPSVSHDIGGHTGGLQESGSQPGETKLPDDLYARWVQFGTFQPIDRLHSNHSARLPWQYGTAARSSADAFLNLRENLLPYTYSLAQQASATGLPIVRPLYLQYPAEQEAYAQNGAEYLYGPDVLVAPVTTPGSTATTSVWFPPGSSWTDWFTGRTYAGGSTAKITTDLGSMPVFLRSGGIVTTRSKNVSNDGQNPLTAVTATVAEGSAGSTSLYEDDGTTTDPNQHTSTAIGYGRQANTHTVTAAAAVGHFTGQVGTRSWTVAFTNASAPKTVTVNGRRVSNWHWDSATRTVTVPAPAQSTAQALVVSYTS